VIPFTVVVALKTRAHAVREAFKLFFRAGGNPIRPKKAYRGDLVDTRGLEGATNKIPRKVVRQSRVALKGGKT
jgi:hypothetical protein